MDVGSFIKHYLIAKGEVCFRPNATNWATLGTENNLPSFST